MDNIFNWYAHWELSVRSSVSLVEELKRSLTTEKTDVLLTKSLGLENNPLSKSLIYYRKNNGSKTDPCATPAMMGDH